MIKYNEKKLSVNSVKRQHKEMVLHALLAGEVTTRTQIAKELSISNATVGTIIDELLAANLVSESKDNTTGIGRRPSIVKIESDNVLTMLIDLCCDSSLSYTVMNIHGMEILSDTLNITSNYNDTFINLLENAKSELNNENLTNLLSGICVCISGIYQANNDSVTSCNILELCNIKVSQIVKNYFDVDVFVDNDINLTTRSYLSTSDSITSNILFMYIGSGIGSSIIINGKLYEGNCGFAGEIGQTLIDKNTTLEQIASTDKLFKTIAKHYDIDGIEEARDLAIVKYNDGDSFVEEQISEIIDALSFSLSNIIWINNPDTIYISGLLNILGEKFINQLREEVYSNISQPLEDSTSIEYVDNNILSKQVGSSHILLHKWIKKVSQQ